MVLEEDDRTRGAPGHANFAESLDALLDSVDPLCATRAPSAGLHPYGEF